jgi:hypothetical protein
MRIADLIRRKKKLDTTWIFLGYIDSDSPTWSFDSLKMYYPHSTTKLGVFTTDESDLYGGIDSKGRATIEYDSPTYGQQVMSAGNAPQHTVSFDLSANTATGIDKWITVGIKGLPDTAKIQEIFGDNTGLAGTKGINSKFLYFNLGAINTAPSADGQETSLIFSNNVQLQQLDYYTNRKKAIYATTVKFNNCDLDSTNLDNLIKWVDAGGMSNGTLDYSAQVSGGVPTNVSKAAYDALVARGWTITGTAPPII